ncbi:hypothetical protein ACFYM0_07465 [Streptomyces sp. NPDC006487]|uniref:hypothetical protein n=1 Tax=Streptomyces sp. NPDC006487 TaxID=3364748 RepID=UPI0036B0E2DB
MVDAGLILGHRISRDPKIMAALRLSLTHEAREVYGTPWPEWIKFNTAQLNEAQRRGEKPLSTSGPEGLRPFHEVRVNPGRFMLSVHKSDDPSNSQMHNVTQIGVGKLSFCVEVQR